ncbi:MAG: ATP synthase F1 subunit gamma [Bacteroidales bacterium]|nr:ATP synthase F1 subunit gamma [Bacteroidales bacterium]MCF8390975.1 ATP synthase F1 subunit gamma [Bacteroidales bacterium]
MANLKEIRTRIASVTSTRQITSAMKMVSAAKFKRAQDAIVELRPYANHLQSVLSSLGDALKADEENVYVNAKETGKVLLVVVTSNRGLCGGFNSNVVKKTLSLINNEFAPYSKKNGVDLFLIGKKGSDFFKKTDRNIVGIHNEIFADLNHASASKLASEIIEKFLSGEYNRIEIVYNQFKNAAVQILTNEQFLPIKIEEKEEKSSMHTFTDYIFEPTKEYLVKVLIPKSLKLQFFKAVLDSVASEHGARMTAMHKATDNATEMIKDLKLEYNKARQASITNEILEIVSGANALEG